MSSQSYGSRELDRRKEGGYIQQTDRKPKSKEIIMIIQTQNYYKCLMMRICKKTLDTQIQLKRATDYCTFPKALSFSGLIIQHF